jgi:hypothetical protein
VKRNCRFSSRSAGAIRDPPVPTAMCPPAPSPFSLDDAAQSLAAGRAAKPPRRDQMRAREVLFAPGTIAEKNPDSVAGRWPSRGGTSDAHCGSDVDSRLVRAASARRAEAPLDRYLRLCAWRFFRPLVVRRYRSLARLCRQRRASTRHSGLQYRAWGHVGRNGFSQPLSRQSRCRG